MYERRVPEFQYFWTRQVIVPTKEKRLESILRDETDRHVHSEQIRAPRHTGMTFKNVYNAWAESVRALE